MDSELWKYPLFDKLCLKPSFKISKNGNPPKSSKEVHLDVKSIEFYLSHYNCNWVANGILTDFFSSLANLLLSLHVADPCQHLDIFEIYNRHTKL